MRIAKIVASSVLALGLLGATGAFAVQNSADALSGPAGTMSCGDFTKLDTSAQIDVIKQIGDANPPSSLTSNSGSGVSGTSSTDAAGTSSGALGVGTPLTAGQLIAACQAATPASTLQDAYSKFTSN